MEKINRLEIAENLSKIEKRKAQFEKQLLAMNSEYYKGATIKFKTDTKDFTDKGETEEIVFDSLLMTNYINSEINALQKISDSLIKQLI